MSQVIKAELIGMSELPQLKAAVAEFLSTDAFSFVNSPKYTVFPGFCDVHVHFREPGFSYKETIASGSKAAAAGGYTAVCTMPNLKPVPDDAATLKEQTDIIDKDAVISVYPYGSITKGQRGEELSDFSGMAERAIAFSDDGRGVQTTELMCEAMLKAKSIGKIIVAHCEDNSLLNGGYIHKGEYAEKNGHLGICSESEWGPIARDIELSKETGCAYHVCHISTKESVELIRKAKRAGVDITCETAPHYLIMDDMDLQENGRFKMNPPLRSRADRDALIEGIIDGTIDMIATDHAPHSAEEKSKGLKESAFGVVGLETAFASLYTNLVLKNIITLDRLIELFALNARKRFDIPINNDFTVFDLSSGFKVNPESFISMGKATPFEGMEFKGKCILTVSNGKIVYKSF